LQAFLSKAKVGAPVSSGVFGKRPGLCRHAFPLSTSYTQQVIYTWLIYGITPMASRPEVEPLVIDLQSTEVGYYHVPTYMAYERGDLVFQVPRRSLLAIDAWTHVFIADVVFGLFARGVRFEDRLKEDPIYKLCILARAMYEGKQVLECSELVKMGGTVSLIRTPSSMDPPLSATT
jgi:hypothetical protein